MINSVAVSGVPVDLHEVAKPVQALDKPLAKTIQTGVIAFDAVKGLLSDRSVRRPARIKPREK
jgi:hypothetical protein